MEEMLKQILGEISSLSKGQAQIINRLDSLEENQAGLQKEMQQSFIDLEDGMGLKISALFDAREEQITANERIITDLSAIKGNLERLTLRTTYNEARLQKAK